MFVLFNDERFQEKNLLYRHLETLLSKYNLPCLKVPVKVQDKIETVCIECGDTLMEAYVSIMGVDSPHTKDEILNTIVNIIPKVNTIDYGKSYLELQFQSVNFSKLINQLGVMGTKIQSMQEQGDNLNYVINLHLTVTRPIHIPVILSYSIEDIMDYIINSTDRVGVIYISQSCITSSLTQVLLQTCINNPDISILPLGCCPNEVQQIRDDLKYMLEAKHIYLDKEVFDKRIGGVTVEELYIHHR